MSELGHSGHFCDLRVTSGLPLIADIRRDQRHVGKVPTGDMCTLQVRCALAQLLDCGDNAPKLTGDGFGDNFERRISDLLHGYGRVDGGDFDLSAS
jgi:hypothetical protein